MKYSISLLEESGFRLCPDHDPEKTQTHRAYLTTEKRAWRNVYNNYQDTDVLSGFGLGENPQKGVFALGARKRAPSEEAEGFLGKAANTMPLSIAVFQSFQAEYEALALHWIEGFGRMVAISTSWEDGQWQISDRVVAFVLRKREDL